MISCDCLGGLIDYVGLWDLYCDLLWHDNVIWFLSAMRCMVIWFVSWSYAEHFFSDICCWSCMILWLCGLSGLCVLLLIYPSVLVWYRWGGGTFNLCAVSVLSEWVNVVQLHTDLKNSPIRYFLKYYYFSERYVDLLQLICYDILILIIKEVQLWHIRHELAL